MAEWPHETCSGLLVFSLSTSLPKILIAFIVNFSRIRLGLVVALCFRTDLPRTPIALQISIKHLTVVPLPDSLAIPVEYQGEQLM